MLSAGKYGQALPGGHELLPAAGHGHHVVDRDPAIAVQVEAPVQAGRRPVLSDHADVVSVDRAAAVEVRAETGRWRDRDSAG